MLFTAVQIPPVRRAVQLFLFSSRILCIDRGALKLKCIQPLQTHFVVFRILRQRSSLCCSEDFVFFLRPGVLLARVNQQLFQVLAPNIEIIGGFLV